MKNFDFCRKMLNILQNSCQSLDFMSNTLRSNVAEIYPDAVDSLLSDFDSVQLQFRQKLTNLSDLIAEGESLDLDFRNAIAELRDVAERNGFAVAGPPSASELDESLGPEGNSARKFSNKKRVRIQLPMAARNGSEVPQIPPVLQSEFDRIPAYMRGRTSVDQLNSIVFAFNQTVTEKYELLAQKFGQLGKQQKDLVIRYRDQEGKETMGQHFVVEEDLKSKLNGKEMTFLNKTAIPMLRHLGRIREIRGGGKLVRFLVT